MKEFIFIEGITTSNYMIVNTSCSFDFSFFTPCKESTDAAATYSFMP